MVCKNAWTTYVSLSALALYPSTATTTTIPQDQMTAAAVRVQNQSIYAN